MDPKIDLVEIPSYPFECTAYPQGEFITGCADIMIGKGKDGAFFRLFYPTDLGDIKNVSPANWTPWFLNKKYLEGIAHFEAPFAVSLYVSTISKLLKKARSPVLCESPIINDTFPVVVFSHGLQATRNMSTGLCTDIASYGFIVASVEHRDESACATLTFTPEGQEKYIFQKHVKNDDHQFEIRSKQVSIRAKECTRVLDILEMLNSGDFLTNELDSKFDLQTLKGKIDLNNSIISGHSFGGATTILTLEKDKRFRFGIVLDPWTFPVKDKMEKLSKTIKQPILFVLMEKFQTEKNLRSLKYFQNRNHEFYTMRQGTHRHLTDLVSVSARYSTFLQKFLIQCYEPKCSHEVLITMINALIKKFIFKNLGIYNNYAESCVSLFEENEARITTNLLSRAKKMPGWD